MVKESPVKEEKLKQELLKKFVRIAAKVIFLKNLIYKDKDFSRRDKMAQRAVVDEVKIFLPLFDGQGYPMWRKRMITFLKLKKCDKVVTGERGNEDEATWEQLELKAINYIYSAISDRQMEFICDEETPRAIIRKFDRMYLRESSALQICVRSQLEKIKLSDYSESREFFSAFEKLIIDLKNAGATVTEKEKLNYLLRTLPSSLSHIGNLIDVMKTEDQTVEFVENKIKSFEQQNKDNGKRGEYISNAFKSERKRDGRCFKCGKQGHYINECTNMSFSTNPVRGARGCQRRGGGNFQETQQRHRSYRGSWQRGYGAWQRGGVHLRGGTHQAGPRRFSNNNNEHNDDCNSFYVEVINKNEGNEVEVNNCENQVEWILDSGCTDHIINNESYYNESIVLQNPVNVKVGDGRVLKATKVGQVICNFITDDRMHEVKVKDVFFVKEMDRNLISYGKVTENNEIVSIGKLSKILIKKKN